MNSDSPFAWLMKSERGKDVPELNAFDEHGQRMVEHFGRFWTEAEWAKEVEGRHAYLEARKQERAAAVTERQRERDISDASYADYKARGDQGYADTSNLEENRRLEVGYQREGTVRDDGIPGGGVMAVLLLVLLGGGGLIMALASVMP